MNNSMSNSKNNIELSVIIPFYNSIKTAKDSLESVQSELEKVNLTYEIICVDDGSFDGTEVFLDKWQSENKGVKVFHVKNGGAATARNIGLTEAKGRLIAFNDSDDKWLEGSLQKRLSILNSDSSIFCVTGNHCLEKQKIPHLQKLNDRENIFIINIKNEMFKNYYTTQNSILKREIIDSGIRFKNGMRYSEEMLFFFQIVKNFKCVFCNEKFSESILGKNRFGDSGLSGNLKSMENGELESLRFARKNLGVSVFIFFAAKIFSLLKYFRRVLIVQIRKIIRH